MCFTIIKKVSNFLLGFMFQMGTNPVGGYPDVWPNPKEPWSML